jgi:hypothetical protein
MKLTPIGLASWFCLFALTPTDASAVGVPTNSNLSMSSQGAAISSPGSVASGAAVTFTVSVTSGSAVVTTGRVRLCDAAAPACTDIHLLGTAQLNASGNAVFTVTPGPGSHSYWAAFQGTPNASTSYSPSTSNTVQLTVTGPYPSVTMINDRVYVGSAAPSAPTGTVSFTQTDFNNTPLGKQI